MNSFFSDGGAVVVQLPDWMQWAVGDCKENRRVVLPMIQRGSVWAPHKVLDLWDSLLRGMPIGAFMVSEAAAEASVRIIGESRTTRSKSSDIDLIDGQQRTLAILAGWPKRSQNKIRPLSIWLDILDEPQGEYLFRLLATTKAQPYGFERASMGGQPLRKLERRKLRLGNLAWGRVEPAELWSLPDFMPWEAKFAVPLPELISHAKNLREFLASRFSQYNRALESKINSLSLLEEAQIGASRNELLEIFRKRLTRSLVVDWEANFDLYKLEKALLSLSGFQFPAIQVRLDGFEDAAGTVGEYNVDPPLAILFKRVGVGGEPLSNADYVYSVIKYQAPVVYDAVEALLCDARMAAIYTPTALVMSAVRMTILSMKAANGGGIHINDSARLDKARFARYIREFPGFIASFRASVEPEGGFSELISGVLEGLGYTENFRVGLPRHALCLIPIPLLEVVLAWFTLRCVSDGRGAEVRRLLGSSSDEAIRNIRLPIVRFILVGQLCIRDYAAASEAAIKILQDEPQFLQLNYFPDRDILKALSEADARYALPLPSPSELCGIDGLVDSPNDSKGLRGWSRFDASSTDAPAAAHIELYKRWWRAGRGYNHPILLWLQRDYVYQKFEMQPAISGLDDEVPFDFDHIVPRSQWDDWRGIRANARIIDYVCFNKDGDISDSTGSKWIGDGIGNIHVFDSYENRSYGDSSARIKIEKDLNFARNAIIPAVDIALWKDASGNESTPRNWDENRALAFQRVVERRTFFLYSEFYNSLECE